MKNELNEEGFTGATILPRNKKQSKDGLIKIGCTYNVISKNY